MTIRNTSIAAVALLALTAGAEAQDAAAPAAPAPPQAAAVPATAQVPAPRPARQSWTADRRAFTVGDVITVLIDEYTLAAANMGDVAVDRRVRDMVLGVGGAVSGSALPGAAVEIGSLRDAERRQRGEATRQNRFQGEMTVRVVDIAEGGLLKVEGNKIVHIDKVREELLLSGFVRPQDVTPANIVDSWRLANPQLIYQSNGKLGKPNGSLISRVLDIFWP